MEEISKDIKQNINIINSYIISNINVCKVLIDNTLEDKELDIFKEIYGKSAPFKFIRYISKTIRKIWLRT